MKWKFIFGLILLIPVLIFAVQNSHTVEISFVEWKYDIPVALLAYISLALGIILGILYSYVGRVRKTRNEKRRQQAAAEPVVQSEAAPVQEPEPEPAKTDSAVSDKA